MSGMNDIKSMLNKNMRQYTMFAALIVIGLIFTVLTDGIFLTPRNLSNLFLQTVTIAILGVGMVLIMVAGHIDLSVGFLAGCAGAVAAIIDVKLGMGTGAAIAGAIGVGVLAGLWQGFWVAYRGIPAFIVTLAGWLIFKGLLVAVTNGETIGPVSPMFKAIGQDYIPRINAAVTGVHDTTLLLGILFIIVFAIMNFKKRADKIKYGFHVLSMKMEIAKVVAVSVVIAAVFMIMVLYRGMPYAIVLLTVLVLVFTFITNNTSFGRHVYAIGGNKEAAKLSGINIKQRTLMIFVIMGVLSAIAGIVFTGRLNSASSSAGTLFEMDAIAAAVIGGTSTLGGQGTIVGAIIGALVIATINNGMSLMNVSSEYQFIVKGLILILAVWVDIATRKTAK